MNPYFDKETGEWIIKHPYPPVECAGETREQSLIGLFKKSSLADLDIEFDLSEEWSGFDLLKQGLLEAIDIEEKNNDIT